MFLVTNIETFVLWRPADWLTGRGSLHRGVRGERDPADACLIHVIYDLGAAGGQDTAELKKKKKRKNKKKSLVAEMGLPLLPPELL